MSKQLLDENADGKLKSNLLSLGRRKRKLELGDDFNARETMFKIGHQHLHGGKLRQVGVALLLLPYLGFFPTPPGPMNIYNPDQVVCTTAGKYRFIN